MNALQRQYCITAILIRYAISALVLVGVTSVACTAQEGASGATVSSSIGDDGAGTITVEARGSLPKPPLFYSARSESSVTVGAERIEQTTRITAKVLQGKAETLSFALFGDDDVVNVVASNLKSWSVRKLGELRYLDLSLNEQASDLNAEVTIRSADYQLPSQIRVTHLGPGEAVGFDSIVNVTFATGVVGSVSEASGFSPLVSAGDTKRFQSATGGQLQLSLNRDGATPLVVEWRDVTLNGEMHPSGKSIRFRLEGLAKVSEADAEIMLLAGNAAVSILPTDPNYRVRLANANGNATYKLRFPTAGSFPVAIDFVASVNAPGAGIQGVDFSIATSAIVPMTLKGLESDLEFLRDQQSVVPLMRDDAWLGFLPATGQAKLQWKAARRAGEGKLFFTTTGRIETRVGTGLLRQDHQISYQVLQGELKALSILLQGPGEILDVTGTNIIAWKVSDQGQDRLLDVTLSQPVTGTSQINVRSQTTLGAFPVRVEGLRLNPVGAIRHSGFVRIANLGLVRLEPTGLSGLTQLSPEQFPGDPMEARQSFVYRFPAAEHAFTVAADRIQPDVNISELVLYQLAETDRVIMADVELDIREAPIREWDFLIPADYSVVSVTGASVADYIAASEVVDGRRNLKVIFGADVQGRQLVALHLEKSEVATAGNWVLPRIEYPGVKSIRGDVGIVGAPGFRIAVVETNLLVEKPLAYFPKTLPGLQLAFRIREPGWAATMLIEPLERSIQADVFHLYSLSKETVYGSALINYFVTGSPVSEWSVTVPENLGNLTVDGQDVRTWRREGENLIVSLHQPVLGAFTLLVTFEDKPEESSGSFRVGQIIPNEVQNERGYIQVVSPLQVELKTAFISDEMLKLDPLELPAEFRLLSSAPSLGAWQYTERPFDLRMQVNWFEPGSTVTQVVEFSEANTRVSLDGDLVTDVVYYVKSRGQRALKIKMPADPVRLWEVSVNGQSVTARQTDDATLIPLPGGTDPNVPVEVTLRLGKPAVREQKPELTLPIVYAPVLKTQWNILGDENHVLVATQGTVTPPLPVLRPSGFDWVGKRGIISLILIGLCTMIGTWCSRKSGLVRLLGLAGLAVAIWISVATGMAAFAQMGQPLPLQLSLPILSAEEVVELQVEAIPLWQIDLSWIGLAACLGGIALLASSFARTSSGERNLLRCFGVFAIALGVLLQGGSAPWFYALLAFAILILLFVPPLWDSMRRIPKIMRGIHEKILARRSSRAAQAATSAGPSAVEGASPVSSAVLFLLLSLALPGSTWAANPDGFETADSIKQQWIVSSKNLRLTASGTILLTGKPGDRFCLLNAPAVLTSFDGGELRLTKDEIPGVGLTYVISIPLANEFAPPGDETSEEAVTEEANTRTEVSQYEATFEYQLDAVKPIEGMRVLTGPAAVQEIRFSYDESGWDVISPTAVQIEIEEAIETTEAKILLGPGSASLVLKPRARDVTAEETQFFVEGTNLYLPGPGVVDGVHRLNIRTSQGQVSVLDVIVPEGLTVSSVNGPVGSWQFDADSGRLKLGIEPSQSQTFDVIIETQRGLEPLPIDVTLQPLRVDNAIGQVGMLGIAFGADAQPDKMVANGMSVVNLGDFDMSMLANRQAVLHRVFRYGADGGEVVASVAAVDSEVRVASNQVLSLGDERIVLAVNFAAEITRSGLFQLSFRLPAGLEVESLSGAALHHWAELTEGGERFIILHLNGKTIGAHNFALTLSGNAPTDIVDWKVPKFQLREAERQTGDLVVRPTTGIRLRTVVRQNVSETDPRTMGSEVQGSLAFRLLQSDWALTLGIEKLEPWITGQVLHDVTLREGQTRSALNASFNVKNASIRSLKVDLPISDEDEIKTLRASGDTVSDFIRTAPDSSVWEIQFKRRVVGTVDFRIEYERRGDRDVETLAPAGFPEARQFSYFFAIRAGGRLELEHDAVTQGWQIVDWSTVPPLLREMDNRNSPVFAIRAVTPANPLIIRGKRHSIADALKLRVADGLLTTVLSPTGDQLTAVDVTVEVIQRSSLSVGLPSGGELFSIFVNGESVNSIRQGGTKNAWQFYILPGIDDRTAKVRFVYTVPGNRISELQLSSPLLNVPLENIQWNVIAPRGFQLLDNDGNLELVSQEEQGNYDRESYLSKVTGNRQMQARQATQLLEQANQFLQAGDQSRARWAFNSVANRYALDAASNEDARIQLENLQTQQAIVGLNSRRQRMFLDNAPADVALMDNKQIREAAAENPILQQDQMNFRPQQLSQLLRGNTTEDNAVLQQIAFRLVQHQHTTDPAPQAIIISLPEEGSVYSFSRSVQVAENAPLELDLAFGLRHKLHPWQIGVVLALLILLAVTIGFVATSKEVTT